MRLDNPLFIQRKVYSENTSNNIELGLLNSPIEYVQTESCMFECSFLFEGKNEKHNISNLYVDNFPIEHEINDILKTISKPYFKFECSNFFNVDFLQEERIEFKGFAYLFDDISYVSKLFYDESDKIDPNACLVVIKDTYELIANETYESFIKRHEQFKKQAYLHDLKLN